MLLIVNRLSAFYAFEISKLVKHQAEAVELLSVKRFRNLLHKQKKDIRAENLLVSSFSFWRCPLP